MSSKNLKKYWDFSYINKYILFQNISKLKTNNLLEKYLIIEYDKRLNIVNKSNVIFFIFIPPYNFIVKYYSKF